MKQHSEVATALVAANKASNARYAESLRQKYHAELVSVRQAMICMCRAVLFSVRSCAQHACQPHPQQAHDRSRREYLGKAQSVRHQRVVSGKRKQIAAARIAASVRQVPPPHTVSCLWRHSLTWLAWLAGWLADVQRNRNLHLAVPA